MHGLGVAFSRFHKLAFSIYVDLNEIKGQPVSKNGFISSLEEYDFMSNLYRDVIDIGIKLLSE